MKRKTFSFFIICLSMLLVFPALVSAKWQSNAVEGKIAPAFILPSITGERVKLKDFCGPSKKGIKQAVVIVFFADYCKVCHDKELPELKELAEQAALKGKVQFLAISIDQKPNIANFKALELPFPVLLDRYGVVVNRYGFENLLPLTIMVLPNGRVDTIWQGYKDEVSEAIPAKIKEVLAKFDELQN